MQLCLEGEQKLTQTIRFSNALARRILILRKFRQRLDDISLHDVRKEGYETLADYKKAWEEINGEGSWDPEKIVTVYEYRLVAKTSKPSSAKENLQF